MPRKFKVTKASVVTAIGVFVLAGVAATVLNSLPVGPLCFSHEKVRAQILKRTPLGCSTNLVLAFINKYHWPPCSEPPGPELGRVPPEWLMPGPTPDGNYVEERDIGTTHFYCPPFETDVIAYWVFDKNGRL